MVTTTSKPKQLRTLREWLLTVRTMCWSVEEEDALVHDATNGTPS